MRDGLLDLILAEIPVSVVGTAVIVFFKNRKGLFPAKLAQRPDSAISSTQTFLFGIHKGDQGIDRIARVFLACYFGDGFDFFTNVPTDEGKPS